MSISATGARAVVGKLDEQRGLVRAGGLADPPGPHDPDEAGDGVGVVGHAPGQHLRLRRDPEGAPLPGPDGRDAAPAAEGTGDGNNQVLPDRRKG